jgi:hypothetical protein
MHVKNMEQEWQLYRTRFLVKAKQLTRPTTIVDALGHEHHGGKGDYLVEFSDGVRRIAQRKFFEDAYVTMEIPVTPAADMQALLAQTVALTSAPPPKKHCGKAGPETGIPLVNRLRYNM